MILRLSQSLFIFSLLLAACAGPLPAVTVATENPSATQPGGDVSTAYPEPVVLTAQPTLSTYPGPVSSPIPGTPGSDYAPQPGDDQLQHTPVAVELDQSEIIVVVSQPGKVKIILSGNLPSPCSFLRVAVTQPIAQNTIQLGTYSLADPKTSCITVLEPFSATVLIGNLSSGHYTVLVNGEKLGEFDTASPPQPGDKQLSRDEAIVDMTSSKVNIPQEQAGEVSILLKGELPDPCHQLRVAQQPTDDQKKIDLEVYSVVDPSTTCISMIQPYMVEYPLGVLTNGHYRVTVNGQLLTEFDR